MKKFGITVVSFFIAVLLFAQKPVIDFDAIKKWPYIGGESISNDGKYVCYYIYRQPADGKTLVVQSTNADWKKEFVNASEPAFLPDSKTIRFKTQQDSSCLLTLGKDSLQYLPDSQQRAAPLPTSVEAPKSVQETKPPSAQDQVQMAIYSYLDHSKKEGETILGQTSDYTLVRNGSAFDWLYESHWNRSDYWTCWLVNTKDSSRKLIRDHITNPDGVPALSPAGKWIIYYDFDRHNFFSYETATGIIRNITRGCNTDWVDESDDRPRSTLEWVPWRKTWLANEEAVLINDNCDIWLIDPSCKKNPVNLTNGYGHRHQIKFEVMNGNLLKDRSIEEQSTLILTAVNDKSKDRGFYRITLDGRRNPELLTMGPCYYGDYTNPMPPLKAKDADVYLVRRMSATESPNLFATTDFKKFTRLTNIHPEENFNWLTSGLVHWKTFDGSIGTGILYKPEDFDSSRKYPVIFNYYEQRSQELNVFISPGISRHNINISWFVSRGYLVFVPDIHYKTGYIGESACNYIVSAAKYLSQKPWVDAKHMGLQGHSFGAFETNYVITHSHLFSAACSVSGVSDFVSYYGSEAPSSRPVFSMEQGQDRMNATLWQRPDLYISNSPIFKADKVSTPLLMVHNRGDKAVPFSQGFEFFTALRRLGKKVWMLQYDDGGHELGGKSAEDYTIRMTQFFDHYLKGAPAPKWMVEGIPAKMKGIDSGMELMPAGVNPGPGLNVEASLKK